MRFPRWRRADRAQLAAHDAAVSALWLNSALERTAGIREETDSWQRLNRRVNELRAPLSPWQRSCTATAERLHRADKGALRPRRRSR